jgi:hypothetical protein
VQFGSSIRRKLGTICHFDQSASIRLVGNCRVGGKRGRKVSGAKRIKGRIKGRIKDELNMLMCMLDAAEANHRYKNPELRAHVYLIAIGEDKLLLLLLLGSEYNGYLLSSNGEDGKLDAIEFVKASPGAALSQSFIYASQSPIIHLVRTVEDYDVLGQRFAHILYGLGFPRPRRTTR